MDSLTEGAIASGMKPYNGLVNQVKKWLGKWDTIEEASEHTLEFIPDIKNLASYLHKTDFYAWLYGYHALFYDLGYTREELAHHLAEWKPIPPREAIKKFSKWKILERPEFDKLDSYSKATTLTAARMTSATIQDGLRPALTSALKQGITLREFKKQVGGKGGKFMNNFHAETIFRTNVNKAYNQGHTESMFHPDIDGLIPGVMFRAVMDMQTTDICMQRDGNVYSKEQISEYGIQPPCHFNCRSTLIPADAQDVEKKGFAAMPTEPASKGFGVFNKVGIKPPAIAPPPITEPIPGIPTTPAPELKPIETKPNHPVKPSAVDKIREVMPEYNQQIHDDFAVFEPIRKSGYESGAVYDASGKQIDYVLKDKASSVRLKYGELKDSGIVIHTHPIGGTFSFNDVAISVGNKNVKTQMVRTPHGASVLQRTSKPIPDAYKNAPNEFSRKYRSRMSARMKREENKAWNLLNDKKITDAEYREKARNLFAEVIEYMGERDGYYKVTNIAWE